MYTSYLENFDKKIKRNREIYSKKNKDIDMKKTKCYHECINIKTIIQNLCSVYDFCK